MLSLSGIMLSCPVVLVFFRDCVVVVLNLSVVIVVFISCVDLVRSLDDESVVVMPL